MMSSLPHQREVGLGVDLDVGDPVDHPGHLAEGAAGRPARLAEGAGELDERRAFPEFRAELGCVESLSGCPAVHVVPPDQSSS